MVSLLFVPDILELVLQGRLQKSSSKNVTIKTKCLCLIFCMLNLPGLFKRFSIIDSFCYLLEVT